MRGIALPRSAELISWCAYHNLALFKFDGEGRGKPMWRFSIRYLTWSEGHVWSEESIQSVVRVICRLCFMA